MFSRAIFPSCTSTTTRRPLRVVVENGGYIPCSVSYDATDLPLILRIWWIVNIVTIHQIRSFRQWTTILRIRCCFDFESKTSSTQKVHTILFVRTYLLSDIFPKRSIFDKNLLLTQSFLPKKPKKQKSNFWQLWMELRRLSYPIFSPRIDGIS